MKHVGDIEIKRQRIYPLDPRSVDLLGLQTTVIVEPGTYPIYEGEIGSLFWMMTGQINKRGFFPHGDGLSTIYTVDAPSGIQVTFPSRIFGPTEFKTFIEEPIFDERFEIHWLEGV